MKAPLIIGAGPAGSAAAITLARHGTRALIVDRHRVAGDTLCGGFVSWRTAQNAGDLGIDLLGLGANPVDRLRLFARGRHSTVPLPKLGFGLSRKAFDSALRREAVSSGATLECDTIRSLEPGGAQGERSYWPAQSVFLATGKSDLRGHSRPRRAADPALGVRVRSVPAPELSSMIGPAIELHLFRGGYAGVVLQEDASANICLALRKSLLTEAGGDVRGLLDALAQGSEDFERRLAFCPDDGPIDTIGAVPYGWVASHTEQGLFRIGDQAAVIPSLAGEGMNIALTSGVDAAHCWLAGGPEAAPGFQKDFARKARRPVAVSNWLWRLAEERWGARMMAGLVEAVPAVPSLAMRLSRLEA